MGPFLLMVFPFFEIPRHFNCLGFWSAPLFKFLFAIVCLPILPLVAFSLLSFPPPLTLGGSFCRQHFSRNIRHPSPFNFRVDRRFWSSIQNPPLIPFLPPCFDPTPHCSRRPVQRRFFVLFESSPSYFNLLWLRFFLLGSRSHLLDKCTRFDGLPSLTYIHPLPLPCSTPSGTPPEHSRQPLSLAGSRLLLRYL